jgi:predicted flavoprotein YhiN
VLNIDGVTWWFNLQAAWSTGNLAWRSIVERLKILK